ncbi:MAG: universal stress protein [Saprospiraceae bacterium]|nr:universal stress protein [Lewinella sp.]
MNKILFPTDFSDAAENAFIYALHLADRFGAQIITLHAFELPQVSDIDLTPNLRKFYDNMDLYEFESYRDAIPPLVETARAHGFEHVEMQHVLKQGDPESVILEVAENDAIDLIVMGTTGARGLKEIFMGSTAGEVMENAHCPVLGVPEKATFDGKLDHIAFATDFKEEDQHTLHLLRIMFAPFDPTIHCLNVDLSHTEEYTNRMDKFAAAFKGQANLEFHVLEGTDIYEALTNCMDKTNIDLLAMVTHQRNFLEELFHYSKTKRMVYHSHTPVLALHVQ